MVEPTLIESIGKLSVEVVAVGALSLTIFYQTKGHEKMSKSIDRLGEVIKDKLGKNCELPHVKSRKRKLIK